MKKTIDTWVLSLIGILMGTTLLAQSPRERSVELRAQILDNQAGLRLEWTTDASAEQYEVYRKSLEATTWGAPLALLSADQTTYVDTDIQNGEAYEYAVFKKRYELLRDTFCVPAGAELNFSIRDMYGIGLCCNFGFGFYQVELCDEVVAYGDNFGMIDSTDFNVCNLGNECEDLIITFAPDMFPNSTSWTLTNRADGSELASSGPVGAFISERSAYGFIYAGIEAKPIEFRGTILLLVEETINSNLSTELDRLRMDLIGEGWKVIRRTAQKEEAVTEVRSRIQQVYAEHPELSTLFIIGHVPVPYSGDIYPDTHSENHQGAWSADTYYGELNGIWTDEVADITTAFFERNHNIPGDGRFDQDSIPSRMELEVGRVDFFDMPAFDLNELELTRQYLNKDHLFRTGAIVVERRALIDDNFGNAFAAPAASGWRNFAPMFGSDQIVAADYFDTMADHSYLWSYGCGSGSHLSAAGVGTTDDFAADSLLTVFTMLFGSQFGDWDNENNFLKAPLASGLTLSNCWAGNPPWTFHQMALGQHLGYCAIRTQNSENEVYLPGPQLVHSALMGDPSLTMHIVQRPTNFQVISTGSTVELSWDVAIDENILGYYLYRSADLDGDFERIHEAPIEETTYIDLPPTDGQYYYALRTLKLEQSASGSYQNLSTGVIDSTDFVLSFAEAQSAPILLYPNPTDGQLYLRHQDLSQPYEVQLSNQSGQLLWQQKVQAGANEYRFQLPELPTGIYLFQVIGSKDTWMKKVYLE
ncbi:MAG: T9SS type A sorting domain-containing protein [Bacteroidota bacterium]